MRIMRNEGVVQLLFVRRSQCSHSFADLEVGGSSPSSGWLYSCCLCASCSGRSSAEVHSAAGLVGLSPWESLIGKPDNFFCGAYPFAIEEMSAEQVEVHARAVGRKIADTL